MPGFEATDFDPIPAASEAHRRPADARSWVMRVNWSVNRSTNSAMALGRRRSSVTKSTECRSSSPEPRGPEQVLAIGRIAVFLTEQTQPRCGLRDSHERHAT